MNPKHPSNPISIPLDDARKDDCSHCGSEGFSVEMVKHEGEYFCPECWDELEQEAIQDHVDLEMMYRRNSGV